MYIPINTSEELLPVVNENDEVIGSEKRGVIHEKKLLHRAVHILMFNSQGNVYIQRRSMEKDAAPGKWDSSASGHVDSGESYEESANRELAEELNIKSAPALQFVGKLPASRQTGWEFSSIFSTCCDETPNPNPQEIMDGKWIIPEQLDASIAADPKKYAGCFRRVWEFYRTCDAS